MTAPKPTSTESDTLSLIELVPDPKNARHHTARNLARLLQLRELATLEARVTELERSVGLEEVSR